MPADNTPIVSSDPNVSVDDKGNAPAEVEVKIGDKAVKVSADVAAALDAAQKAATEAGATAAQLKAEMAALNDKLTQATAAPAKDKPAEPGLDVLLFTDPEVAIAKIEDRILAKVREAQSQNTAQEAFWTEFYKEHKDLKEMDGYVRFVFQRDFASMSKAGMTVGDAIKKLGETVKGEVLKMTGKQPGKGKPVGEGGSEGNRNDDDGSKPNVSEDSRTPLTASILAERKAARKAAAQPGRRK